MSRKATEGKTLGVLATQCQNCTETMSSYNCPQCYLNLCVPCERFHSKSNITKDHTVFPVDQQRNEASKTISEKVYCDIHKEKPLTSVCGKCIEPLCRDCTLFHKGHNIIQVESEIGVAQRICMQGVPEIMALMENVKLSELSNKVELCKEVKALAIQRRERIVSVIVKESDRLLCDIEREMENEKHRVGNEQEIDRKHMTRTENVIGNLTGMRHVSDPNVLLGAIKEYYQTTKDIKCDLSIREKVVKCKPENMLASAEIVNDMAQMAKSAFTLVKTKVKINLGRLRNSDSVQIFSEDKEDKSLFRASERMDDRDLFVVYRVATGQVFVLCLKTMTKEIFECDRDVYNMISLSNGQHVMIECGNNLSRIGLHLLNHKFHVISTMSASAIGPGSIPDAFCIESYNTFILRELLPHGNGNRFLRVTVANNMFSFTEIGRLRLDIMMKSMCFDGGLNTITLLDKPNSVGVVHLGSMMYKSVIVDVTVGSGSLYVNNDTIFVGSGKGKLQEFTFDGECLQSMNIGRGETYVTGIARRGDNLIVLADGIVHVLKPK